MKNLIKNLSIITFFLLLIFFLFIYKAAAEVPIPTTACKQEAGSVAYSTCTSCNQSSRNYYNCDGTTYLVPEDNYFDPTCSNLCASAPIPTPVTSSSIKCPDGTYVYGTAATCPTPTPKLIWNILTFCSVETPTDTPIPTTTPAPNSTSVPAAQSPATASTPATSCPNGYDLSGTVKGKPSNSTPITVCLDPQGGDCNTNLRSTATNTTGSYSIPGVSYTDHSIKLQGTTLPEKFFVSGPNPDVIYKANIPNTCTYVYDFTIINPNSTPTPTPTPVKSTKSCLEAGNICKGPDADPSTSTNPCKNVTNLFGPCDPSWQACWQCKIATAPVPTSTPAPAVGPGGGTSSNNVATAPIPSGRLITLHFQGVTLPGINSNVQSVALALTFFRGKDSNNNIATSTQSIPGNPSIATINRQAGSDTFSGDVTLTGSTLPALFTDTQFYFMQIGANSYQAKISGNDGTKARTITEIQSQMFAGLTPIQIFSGSAVTTVPTVSLLPGDVNNNGEIDGADLGIIVACFGKKNVLTDSAGRTTECRNKTQNGEFNADIDKNGNVDGIDINLWSRGANGIL